MKQEHKKRTLRIIFMGTPDFAVEGLKKIIQGGYHVVGVITAPDRPAGRGRKLRESAVKIYAKTQGLKILQPTNLKDEAFLEELRSLNANLQVVVAFRMLPKVVWQMPKYGTFNLHASLLPQYRGAAPINWAIINGERETGATTFFIDEKIDTGEIILQEKTEIGADETAGELHDKLMVLGAELIVKTVAQIENGEVKPTKQNNLITLKTAHKIHKETCEIDWSKPITQIHNHIRGLSPYPGAWTTLIDTDNTIQMKIFKTVVEIENHGYAIGQVITDRKTIRIAVEDGLLKLIEIQLAGKRKMNAHEVLNGLTLSKNTNVR